MLTVDIVADMFSVSRASVGNYIKRGVIKAIDLTPQNKCRHQYRIDPKEIERFTGMIVKRLEDGRYILVSRFAEQ